MFFLNQHYSKLTASNRKEKDRVCVGGGVADGPGTASPWLPSHSQDNCGAQITVQRAGPWKQPSTRFSCPNPWT